jgi:pyroglutamyl-peptidase
MQTILITGFGPFGTLGDNPSAAIAARLDGTVVEGRRLVGCVLPVAIEPLASRLETLVERLQPAAVLQFGVAETSDRLRLERRAVNQAAFSIPDIAGVTWRDRALVEGGPAQLATTLPLGAIADAWRIGGLAYALSDDAGRYVCNAAFYFTLMLAQRARPTFPAGFIHVPLPQEVNPASRVRRDAMIEAARRAVEVTLLHRTDPAAV